MGGEAKLRRAEIAELKKRSPEEAERWRQLQNDQRTIRGGINPESRDITVPAATARALATLFDEARRTGDIDPPVALLYSTIDGTLRGMKDIPIACKKGCSPCCHTWVSVSAPEALYIAKIVMRQGNAALERVRSAHEQTKHYDFDARDLHPHACALLVDDACSIYEARPKVCRFAASADAGVCARAYHNIEKIDIPMPMMHLIGRGMYATTMAAGLRHAGLPHHAYEFNGALLRALETERAEQRWLAGEDIFAGLHQDPQDAFAEPQAQQLYNYTFTGNEARPH